MLEKTSKFDHTPTNRTVHQSPSPAATNSRPSGPADSLLEMQRDYGNRYVQQVLTGGRAFKEDVSEFMSQSSPSKIEVELQPHQGNKDELRALAPFYKAGRTPYFDTEGRLQAFEVAPADALTTGYQLGKIQQRFGDTGVNQTVTGLTLTRGGEFTTAALRYAPVAVARGAKLAMVDDSESEEGEPVAARSSATLATRTEENGSASRPSSTIGDNVAQLLTHSGKGSPLPAIVRKKFAPLARDPLHDVRLHYDGAANAAADLLGARAFTIGRSVYFAAGEFDPGSARGRHLLAHELAHTVQQRRVTWAAPASLRVSTPFSSEETEAERFADAATTPCAGIAPPTLTPVTRAARVQRAIRFARSNDVFTRNSLVVNESAAGFTIRRNTAPLFGWFADVTINGNAGDPFANFEVGPHQVVRNFRGEFTWGSGANRGRRVLTCSTLPIRDATAAGNTWYHDPFAQAFGANGDVRNTGLNDSPSPGTQPWNNPVPGKVGNTGTFAFTAAFVAYISARDTTKGTGAAAFRALNNVYWNSSISGNFDASQPLGSRANASGGTVNRSGIISGGSGEFPSMHGGAIANNSFTTTDT